MDRRWGVCAMGKQSSKGRCRHQHKWLRLESGCKAPESQEIATLTQGSKEIQIRL